MADNGGSVESEGYSTSQVPFDSGWLRVSELHEIYYEQSGKADGNPVVFLHGGPGGSGCKPSYRQFFDPDVYRVIFLDQRGAGRSRPHAELKENTTWDLVEDIEKLRKHLGIEKWVVLGGSWGSTLALVYAIKHTCRIKALIIAAVVTFRKEEILWLYQKGASFMFPDYWHEFVSFLPESERGDIINAFYRRLAGNDKEAAQVWSRWERRVSSLNPDLEQVEMELQNVDSVLSFAKIECHYFVHGAWLDDPEYILNNVDKIKGLPGTIVQGRYDVVAPMKTAWELHQKWPEAEFHVVPLCGHSVAEPGLRRALIMAAEKYKNC